MRNRRNPFSMEADGWSSRGARSHNPGLKEGTPLAFMRGRWHPIASFGPSGFGILSSLDIRH